MGATKSFDSFMDFNMFVKVGSLSKTEIAISESAFIRPFIGMNPKMIKKIVPFSEVFVTVFLVAFENFYISF